MTSVRNLRNAAGQARDAAEADERASIPFHVEPRVVVIGGVARTVEVKVYPSTGNPDFPPETRSMAATPINMAEVACTGGVMKKRK